MSEPVEVFRAQVGAVSFVLMRIGISLHHRAFIVLVAIRQPTICSFQSDKILLRPDEFPDSSLEMSLEYCCRGGGLVFALEHPVISRPNAFALGNSPPVRSVKGRRESWIGGGVW